MNQQRLLVMGVTHIVNCTHDLPSEFPGSFVYMRIPIKDEEQANAGQHFPKVIEFFKRVEDKQGKMFVHCTVGASRAPTMVIAYLVAARGVPLADAFDFLRLIRPQVAINWHFLFQLAQLEVAQGMGSSVQHHAEWRFYEYNFVRVDDGYHERKRLD